MEFTKEETAATLKALTNHFGNDKKCSQSNRDTIRTLKLRLVSEKKIKLTHNEIAVTLKALTEHFNKKKCSQLDRDAIRPIMPRLDIELQVFLKAEREKKLNDLL